MKNMVALAVLAISTVACNGGSSGGSSSSVISKSFSDSTVSNFSQTSGVAAYQKKWHEYLISSAYAGGGDISCISGSDVSVSMDITLGGTTTPLQVDSKCGDDIELEIRRKMLTALDGHQMILEMAGQGDTGVDYSLGFLAGFEFDKAYPTLEDKDVSFDSGTTIGNCKIDYIFDSSTGKVRNNTKTPGAAYSLDMNSDLNDLWNIPNPNDPEVSGVGCKTTDGEYRDAHFRFKNGKIELDESGRKAFSPKGCAKRNAQEEIIEYNENGDGSGVCPAGFDSTYERWCIDDNLDGTCDV